MAVCHRRCQAAGVISEPHRLFAQSGSFGEEGRRHVGLSVFQA